MVGLCFFLLFFLGLAILIIDYILCLFWVQQWQPKINPTDRTSIYLSLFITICKDPTVPFFPALLYFSMIKDKKMWVDIQEPVMWTFLGINYTALLVGFSTVMALYQL